jgi:hypothetical protein
MDPILVVVLPEICEFSLKVLSIPKEGVVKIFTAIGSDESLNEGMRYRRVGDGLYFVCAEYSQVRLPLVI